MEFILNELKIKERPILFNAEMVRAILEGRKTQTRRIVKGMALDWLDNAKFDPFYVASPDNDMCPNGKVGDQIWVRETCQSVQDGMRYGVNYPANNHTIWFGRENDANWLTMYDYRGASGALIPSIHMPRWASRIQLEIASVRIERLQAISEEDAEAEGIESINQPTGGDDYQDYWRDYGVTEKEADGWPWFTGEPIASFKSLWNSIYKNWDFNPWVWVIEFKKLKPHKPIPKGWTIKHNPKPIPSSKHDYDFYHENYDGENNLSGTAESIDDAVLQVEEIEAKCEQIKQELGQ